MIDPITALTSRIEGATATGAAGGSAAAGSSAATAAVGGPSFGDVLDQVASGTIQSLRGAEAASIQALQGKGTTLEVVEAIKSAEQALQTAIAVRDKAVQAYQEISRMAI